MNFWAFLSIVFALCFIFTKQTRYFFGIIGQVFQEDVFWFFFFLGTTIGSGWFGFWAQYNLKDTWKYYPSILTAWGLGLLSLLLMCAVIGCSSDKKKDDEDKRSVQIGN